jgi:uncharacterized membrane-anchored protein
MNKLPQITLAFWIMKICATTLGETAGDLLSMTLNVGYLVSTIILLSFFAVTLVMQLRSKTYIPFLYWLVILSTSTAGTTMSDYMDRTLKLGYATGSLILVSTLVANLTFWKVTEKSISVVDIKTFKVECLYWAAILVSNTLGTAFGDFLADDSGLGFAGGALLVSSLIAVVALMAKFTNLSKVALFWAAFVLTRPLGATVGDLMTKGHEKGGLGIGTIGSSAVLLVTLIIVIFVSTRNQPKPTSELG